MMPDWWEASDAKSKDADALDQNCFNYNGSAVPYIVYVQVSA